MPDRQEGRRYVWASREDRQLNRRESGDWVYYISPEGSGYVKVFTAQCQCLMTTWSMLRAS